MTVDLAETLQRIKETVGPPGWIADPQDQEPYLVEARLCVPRVVSLRKQVIARTDN